MSNVKEYKCPNCGGALNFDINSQNIKCAFCDTEFKVEDVIKYNDSLTKENKDSTFDKADSEEIKNSDNIQMFICESCGGELLTDSNTAATSCPYCGSPVILSNRLSGVLKPDYVIPFKKTKEETFISLSAYLKKKLFLPRAFRTDNKVEEIKGIYAPFWLYSADVDGYCRYKATRNRYWSDNDYDYKETEYYLIIREGSLSFSNIAVDGSKSLPDDLMESIEPFDFKEAKDFNTVYLTGHLADKYDVTSEQCAPRAKERINQGTEMIFKRDVLGYDTVETESVATDLSNKSVKYALYPIYIMNTKWKDKKYLFAINGQSGKITGNLPISKLAYTLWFIGLFLGTGALFFLLAYFVIFNKDILYSILMAIGCGIITPAIFCHINRKALKPVTLTVGADNYFNQDSLEFTNRQDIYLYHIVTRTPKPKNNNNK